MTETASLAKKGITSALVPAAGLGTRLSPLTLGMAKELLPLGAYPALTTTLLEAVAAGVKELILITSPAKPELGRWFTALRSLPPGAPAPAVELARLLTDISVRVVEQPQPLGVLDAVARGLALTEPPCAVLFPDLIHLPDQRALSHLVAAYAACGQAVIGLRERTPDRSAGNTVAVKLRLDFATPQARQQASSRRAPLPICAVGPARGEPGELLTTFGQIHTQALGEAIERCCRPQPEAPLSDSAFTQALDSLAAAGKLYGVLLPGEVIDLGSLPSYLDAVRRFSTRQAQLRNLP